MRTRPLAGPDRGSLAATPVHVVVRDWPETLVGLRGAGLDLAAEGGAALGDLSGSERLVDACLEATAWRGDGA